MTPRTINAELETRNSQLRPGRRYRFRLRSGHVWCGTLCHSCDKLIVLTGAIEFTELWQKAARAFFAADVLAVGELLQ